MSEKKIFVTGLPRSGSTFIWQCINKMILEYDGNYTLSRNHGGLHNQSWDFPIFTCRDIIDVVKSLSITHEISIEEVLKKDFFNDYLTGFLNEHRYGIVIKYEKYLPHDPELLLHDLNETIFDGNIGPHLISSIAEEYSISNNAKRASKYKDFSGYDKNGSMIHGKHITSNGFGLGSKISESDKEMIENHPGVRSYIKVFNSL